MTLQATLEDIRSADRATLSASWETSFDAEPPPNLSQPLMRMMLSNHVQTQRLGGLDRTSKRMLKRLQKQINAGDAAQPHQKAKQLEPGARLIREWNGQTYIVERTQDGYLWNGQTFRSLSAIARVITRTRWSGPRFFGLQKATL